MSDHMVSSARLPDFVSTEIESPLIRAESAAYQTSASSSSIAVLLTRHEPLQRGKDDPQIFTVLLLSLLL